MPARPARVLHRRAARRLAARLPGAGAAQDLVVEVPPLQTRPKAALARRRPARDPAARGAEALPGARRADARGPALGSRARARRDRRPRAARGGSACCARSAATLRESDFDVTAVVVDDLLIDVEPGDTTGAPLRVAFDLGTTTVVATLLDLETGQPVAVRSMLNRQQPYGADVISRISATMLDEARSARCGRARTRRSTSLPARSARRPGVEPRRGLRDHRARQRDDDPARARHRPRAAVDGAVHRRRARAPADHARPTSASTVHPRAPAFVFPSLGAYVGGDIVAGMLATGLDPRPPAAAVHRRRHEQRDRARLGERVLATAAPAGPAFEAAQIRCGMRAAEGAIEGVKIVGDELRARRSSATPSPSGSAARASWTASPSSSRRACSTTPAASSRTRTPAESRPRSPAADEDRRGARVRLHWRGEDPPTSVFLSQRDVRELQFAKASIATGWQHPAARARPRGRRHQAGAAGRVASAPTCPPRARSASASCRGSRCRGSSRPATSPARARRWRRCRCASAPRRGRSSTRSSTWSCPAAPTSTTCSSTSSRSRDEPRRRRRLRRARRCTSGRSRAGAAGTSTCTRCRRCCTTGPEQIARPCAAGEALRPLRRRSRSRTPTAARTARSTPR